MKKTILAASMLSVLSSTAFAATYQLTELPRYANGKNTFISDVNESGDIIGAATELFNYAIDVSQLDIDDADLKTSYDSYLRRLADRNEEATFTLDDIKNGISATNADANSFMLGFLAAKSSDAEYQKLNDRIGLTITANSADEFVIFDTQSSNADSLTRSVTNFPTAITNDGVIAAWGSAPYRTEVFTKEGEDDKTFYVRDWSSRGLVISPSGKRVTLEPELDTYGGYSSVADIVLLDSGNYIAVGNSSVSIPENSQESYNEQCDGVDELVQVCSWNLQRSSFYNTEAYQWELDNNFNVISTKKLGLGLVRKEDEKGTFSSFALATNKNGVSVGYSNVRNTDDDRLYSYEQAGYFKDGQFIRIHDHEDYIQGGKAIDINNNNIVIGNYYEQGRSFGGGVIVRKKVGFYYDINADTYKEIPAFFNGSKATLRDINDQGQIIGQGEIEKNTSVPKYEAFLYEIGSDTVTNINDFLPCKAEDGSTFPYTIAEATKITESGHIYANATKTVERRDSLGQVMKDSEGNIEKEAVSVPVLLTPIAGGTIEECTASEAEQYERQSASFGFISLFALPLLWLRRRKA
ncbi:DUF3466 family protein [Pseudoalteromonas sp. MTN2-4]|uniref:DUF3466 family protein n=1 Tax=Pseudoalteromonas sp. MTN2-4 TaxID=3056555 RepID=UPI0036F273DD